jgi:hypothetical protein
MPKGILARRNPAKPETGSTRRLGASATGATPEPGFDRVAVPIVCACLAVFFTFSAEYCAVHNMDTLIPTLASRQNVTLYYWGQNRYGTLFRS